MTIRYTVKVLPDGHLPLPEGGDVKAGDEVEVTVTPTHPAESEQRTVEQNVEAARYLLEHWSGVIRGGPDEPNDIALNHDKYIYTLDDE